MNGFIVLGVVLPFALFIFCCTASLKLAVRKDNQLRERLPDMLPYTWGYFLGYSGLIGGLIMILTGVALTVAGFYRDWFPIALVYVVTLGIASYGVLIRRRWGWFFHIPLSLNPGLWAFNSVYAHNRWRELPWH